MSSTAKGALLVLELEQLQVQLLARKKFKELFGGVAGAGVGAGTGAIIDGSKKINFIFLIKGFLTSY
jgi:hypothetical protein